MRHRPRSHSALLAVFPTTESYRRFISHAENKAILDDLAAFAAKTGLIELPDPQRLAQWVARHAVSDEVLDPPQEMDFAQWLDRRETVLEFRWSARALADRVNTLLETHRIGLPKIANAMLSRLKKEPADTAHKCNVLRSMAFWLGHERPHLAARWHFEHLLRLCRGDHPAVQPKDGVRVAFGLYSRGEVIDQEIVAWLKRALKQQRHRSQAGFPRDLRAKVRYHDTTTLYVDIPKESLLDYPSAYRRCLRVALFMAHQTAIRWSLSGHCTGHRFLAIAMAAGDFDKVDNQLYPALAAKLPGDPVIRMTDDTRQYLLINEMRALLNRRPVEITLFNGETLPIWWVVGFWSALYFDFVPDLLEDAMLQNHPASARQLARKLWASIYHETAAQQHEADAVTALFRFPRNSLLGVEIAKTLYYRRRFWDAIDILKVVLHLDPMQLNARTLRMTLLRNLAIDAPGFAVSADMFKQAYMEAEFIMENCDYQAEDFFCEYAVVFLAEAMTTLRRLRRGEVDAPHRIQTLKSRVFECLQQADTLLTRGMMLSPTGIRSNYLLYTVKILRNTLLQDDTLFEDTLAIDVRPCDIRQTVTDFQWQMGYFRGGATEEDHRRSIETNFRLRDISHGEAISLQAYRPTTFFCAAVAWWDLFPVRTTETAERVISLLRSAAAMAREMEAMDLCIYSFTRTYGEMITAREFIRHMHKGIAMISAQDANHSARGSDQTAPPLPEGGRIPLLMTLNF